MPKLGLTIWRQFPIPTVLGIVGIAVLLGKGAYAMVGALRTLF
jgi:hypothetical protein